MQRTSSIVSGRAWVEWLERTTFSLPMPFRCALSYRTTPSVRLVSAPSPSTATIE